MLLQLPGDPEVRIFTLAGGVDEQDDAITGYVRNDDGTITLHTSYEGNHESEYVKKYP